MAYFDDFILGTGSYLLRRVLWQVYPEGRVARRITAQQTLGSFAQR